MKDAVKNARSSANQAFNRLQERIFRTEKKKRAQLESGQVRVQESEQKTQIPNAQTQQKKRSRRKQRLDVEGKRVKRKQKPDISLQEHIALFQL